MKEDKDKLYTYDEFVEGLMSGEIRLSVPVLTGMNGSKYVLKPVKYESSPEDIWKYININQYGEVFSVPSLVTKKDGTWFQAGPLLRGLHLADCETDIEGIVRDFGIYVRKYSPFNRGYKRNFIHESALLQLGYNLNREIIHSEKLEIFKEVFDADKPRVDFSTKFGIPYYNVDFITGYDYIFGNQYATPEYNIVYSPFKNADVWCNMTGDNLTPQLNDGDIIALKEVQVEDIIYGEMYAIVLSNDIRTIKTIRKGIKLHTLKLTSTNPYYKDIMIDQREITKIYSVLGSIKAFM